MDEFLTDEQQADRVRAWLSENGLYLVGGLVLGLGAIFGWDQWQGQQLRSAGEASAQYEEALVAIRLEQSSKALELVGSLESEWPGSPYVTQAHLMLARMYADSAEYESAADSLRKVIDSSGDDNLVDVARLRLSRVLLQLQKPDEALAILDDGAVGDAFVGPFHEARGDAHHALGDLQQAQTEYALALTEDRPGILNRQYVQVKLDDVSVFAVDAEPEEASSESQDEGSIESDEESTS